VVSAVKPDGRGSRTGFAPLQDIPAPNGNNTTSTVAEASAQNSRDAATRSRPRVGLGGLDSRGSRAVAGELAAEAKRAAAADAGAEQPAGVTVAAEGRSAAALKARSAGAGRRTVISDDDSAAEVAQARSVRVDPG
jgi:hypothetical protein